MKMRKSSLESGACCYISEDSKEKGMILHMKVLYILNGSEFPEGKFISKQRLYKQMAPDTNPKAKDTLPDAASHDSKNV